MRPYICNPNEVKLHLNGKDTQQQKLQQNQNSKT